MRTELERFILEYGPHIPKQKRKKFCEDLGTLMVVSGNEAIDSFIERFKQRNLLES